VRPRSGAQPYVLQQRKGSRWVSLGTKQTSRTGFFKRTVTASKGVKFRVWSPRDEAYSPTLTIA
jgi:hypothetical protein